METNLKYHHIGIKAIYCLNMDHILDAIIDGMHNPWTPQVARLEKEVAPGETATEKSKDDRVVREPVGEKTHRR